MPARIVYPWQHALEVNSGHEINQDTWLNGQALRQKLQRQSEAIADRLELVTGSSWRREDSSLVDLVTGQVSTIKGYRNSNLIPCIARPKRQKMALHLEAFLQEQTSKAYYWVFTSGDRCKASEMAERRAKLSRTLTLLQKPLREKYGVEVIFKGVESPVDENGKDSWHVHANVVVLHHRKLSGAEWQKMRAMVHGRLGAWWKDNGELKQLQEVCKYVTKLEDLAKIEDETFKAFAESLQGARLYETYGSFQAWRKQLDESKQRVRKVVDGGGDFSIVREARRARKAPVESLEPSTSPVIMSITAPIPAFDPQFRPCALVARYDGDFRALLASSPDAREARLIALCAIEARNPDSSHLHLNSIDRLEIRKRGIELPAGTEESRNAEPVRSTQAWPSTFKSSDHVRQADSFYAESPEHQVLTIPDLPL